ncbi:structural protein [Pseudomonas phage vB_PaeM_PA5oct]|uniref:Structural protein n=1 Tax=Pseudomonas phage vB_PaeM_PA5oct TaxID=2163605 RepID=A0A4Y5JUS2_9CAUD|nr:structural protein [Pseudomonas phage vB_PaeM_PA5oct]QCG75921.1 structural protein [Pseudomonas phage vB_PaeM_PA5oct]
MSVHITRQRTDKQHVLALAINGVVIGQTMATYTTPSKRTWSATAEVELADGTVVQFEKKEVFSAIRITREIEQALDGKELAAKYTPEPKVPGQKGPKPLTDESRLSNAIAIVKAAITHTGFDEATLVFDGVDKATFEQNSTSVGNKLRRLGFVFELGAGKANSGKGFLINRKAQAEAEAAERKAKRDAEKKEREEKAAAAKREADERKAKREAERAEKVAEKNAAIAGAAQESK